MARDDRQFLLRQIAFDHVQVGPADGTTADANAHLARARLDKGQIDQFQRRGFHRRDVA
jgi:hypothetical protein